MSDTLIVGGVWLMATAFGMGGWWAFALAMAVGTAVNAVLWWARW